MKKFVSVRTKLTASAMTIISVIFVAVLSIVTYINVQTVNTNIQKSEHNIRNALIAKGNTLVTNNSIAMTGMAEDNAFTAIRELVTSTVKEDSDMKYGIYMMDKSYIPWAYALSDDDSDNTVQNIKPLNDNITKWAGSLKNADYKAYAYEDKEEVIEFAAPVSAEGQIHGFIRYGISTESMRTAIEDARADGIRTRNRIITALALLCLISLSISYLTVRRLSYRITHPVSNLVESAKIIAQGNYDVPVTSDSNDEIGLLVKDIDTMRISIRELTENMKEKERLKSEMELAQKIQSCLLPAKPEIPGYEIAASCEPAEEVGGDYYDVISVAGYDWIVIGDVSGHGVTAGLVMMMVQTAIHTALIQNPVVPPSHLLSVINRVIYENIEKMQEAKHMTIIVLASEKDGVFSFSGLHEDILVWRAADRRVDKIQSNGMWIGFEPDISAMLAAQSLKLEPGDCMVLYTDGITEARSKKDGSMFEEESLVKTIEKSGNKSASQIHLDTLESLKDYDKPDDATLFVMRRV